MAELRIKVEEVLVDADAAGADGSASETTVSAVLEEGFMSGTPFLRVRE